MTARDEIMSLLRDKLDYLRREYGVSRIGLFGSFAKGTGSLDSDVDLVVEFTKPIGLRFVELAERLEQIVGRKTDILTPAGIAGIRNKEIAENIKRTLVYV